MINHTDDYEEAKVIIKNSIDDDFAKKVNKAAKLRAIFGSVAGIGAVVAAGLVTQNPVFTATMVPICGRASIPFLVPFFSQKSGKKKVESGEFFREHSKEDIINRANSYADQYNEFESRRR